ncbi:MULTISPECIES: FAD-dependent oxidoreductase [Ramlibacter]|uniref:FAD-dependent oxidoreductase n=1 Tax=Ramlibacter pinisoli TaxID=2682844 RepID=A0A6N8IWD8_9BURK|nr:MULTISPECIES: FAD-dependent oxidoreductase [Ramlibacter]MBA2965342.1 FAD-dependent oxidoreductase [Ramlibacter sp. CGMCC 1.13660]MVQ30306.1 FAD-dependent oxidoreductase [Ramlibacter pinisoli]
MNDHQPAVLPAQRLAAEAPALPVAIVGAGACGLVAATVLRDAGIDCVLLERDARPAGSTALSSGFIPAAGTRAQRACGIEDSPERFARDIQAKAKGHAAPHLVRAYTEAIAPALDHLEQRHGIAFELLDGFLYPGHGVRRMHAVRERTGAALMAQLERAATGAGAWLVGDATVRELYVDDQRRIQGVGYRRPDGTLEQLRCQQLLLACNGFGGHAAMVAQLLPAMRDATFAGHAGNDGSAIRWGQALGARLADLGGYQGHGSWVVPHGILMTWAVMAEGGVQLNRLGRRFHDETHGYSEAAVEVLRQPDGIAWNVFDDHLLALARGFPDFQQAEAAGAVRSAPDRAALAALIGCPVEALDPALDRFTPPFHAVKVTGALFHTQGGLDIDAQCRVLDQQGRPFPNLLAAGGTARGVSGDAVWGYLSGNGLLSAVAGGWIAARTAITTGGCA